MSSSCLAISPQRCQAMQLQLVYFFTNPLGKGEPLQVKILRIALHILTFAIPYAAYRLISKCCFKQISYTPLGQEALRCARAELAKHPEILVKPFAMEDANKQRHGLGVFLQPTNPEILRLIDLSEEQGLSDDMRMKIDYAITNLTLDELGWFVWINKTEIRNVYEAVTARGKGKMIPYAFYTLRYCTNTYHDIRKGAGPEAIDCFYQQGTVENSWRGLYNDYCARLKSYVNTEDLEKEERILAWSQPDEEAGSFRAEPDTQST